MFRSLKPLLNDNLLIAPGVYDGLSARLGTQAGFQALYASGGAIARSSGRPDIGLLTLSEVITHMADIVQATDCPIIADADTGFGNEWNVQRTVNEFERIGISAIHLEDQLTPKRCGHLEGKSLITQDEMCLKIRAAVAARHNPDFMIIARTDAIAVTGFDDAITRAKAYAASGADMLFVEAPTSRQQIEAIAQHIPQPKLINMFYGGKTPLIPRTDLEAMGYQVAIIPSDLQRAAIKAMQKTLDVIFEHGDSGSIASELATFKERETIIGTQRYLELAKNL